jgi:hypothetical protein
MTAAISRLAMAQLLSLWPECVSVCWFGEGLRCQGGTLCLKPIDMENIFTITGLWHIGCVVPIANNPFTGRNWNGSGLNGSCIEAGKRHLQGGCAIWTSYN